MDIALSCRVDIREILPPDHTDSPKGLGGTATTPFVLELLRRGHSVSIFTLSEDVEDEVVLERDRLRVVIGPARRTGQGRDLFKQEVGFLSKAISKISPQFVHAHWTYEFALGALSAGVPTLTTIHDQPWRMLASFRDKHRAARLAMAYKVAMRCKNYVAVSDEAARHFAKWMRPGASIEVIPNFLPDWIFELPIKFPRTKGATLCFASVLQGWTHHKNGICAIRAFHNFRQMHPESRLTMIGWDYEEGGPANRWAVENGMGEGICFRGELDRTELLSLVNGQADVLLHPSLEESLSVTVLEGMAMRKPVIAGERTPGMRYLLDEGKAGLLVDVKDAKEVSDAMIRLQNDSILFQTISDAEFKRAHGKFPRPRCCSPL